MGVEEPRRSVFGEPALPPQDERKVLFENAAGREMPPPLEPGPGDVLGPAPPEEAAPPPQLDEFIKGEIALAVGSATEIPAALGPILEQANRLFNAPERIMESFARTALVRSVLSQLRLRNIAERIRTAESVQHLRMLHQMHADETANLRAEQTHVVKMLAARDAAVRGYAPRTARFPGGGRILDASERFQRDLDHFTRKVLEDAREEISAEAKRAATRDTDDRTAP